MVSEQIALADIARSKFAWISIIISTAALGGALVFFLTRNLVIGGMHFGDDGDTFGWMLLVLSLVTAFLTMILGSRIGSGGDDD